MRPGPKLAAGLIDAYMAIDAPPVRIELLLRRIILSEGWVTDEIEAAERAESWLVAFREQLSVEPSEDDTYFGYQRRYVFNGISNDFLQGACFVEPEDSREIRERKLNRARFSETFDRINSLDPVAFERLCRRALVLMGAEDVELTPRSNDQGIDFFGRVDLHKFIGSGLLPPGAERQLCCWLIGQAKHYKRMKVATDEVRELVGSIEMAKAKAFSSPDIYAGKMEIRLCDPVFYMIITSGIFTRECKSLLKRSGVIAFDGQLLSVFLADKGEDIPLQPS